jgi:hypothetical protein
MTVQLPERVYCADVVRYRPKINVFNKFILYGKFIIAFVMWFLSFEIMKKLRLTCIQQTDVVCRVVYTRHPFINADLSSICLSLC